MWSGRGDGAGPASSPLTPAPAELRGPMELLDGGRDTPGGAITSPHLRRFHQQQQQQQHFAPVSHARVPLRASYLLSSQHAASCTVLHFFQAVDARRVAFGGAPTRRVLVMADEKAWDLDFDAQVQRLVSFSRIEELHVMPADVDAGFCAEVRSSGDGGGDGTAPQQQRLTDLDLLMQQSDPFDFTRSVAALFRPRMSGGAPPIFMLDEAQPLRVHVNCHLRQQPLREAVVDGVSAAAFRAISEQHRLQLKAAQSSALSRKDEYTTEMVDLYQQRDALREQLVHVEKRVAELEAQRRQERDAWRMREAQLLEEVRLAREDARMTKLVRYGLPPSAEEGPATSGGGGGAPFYRMSAQPPQELLRHAQANYAPNDAGEHPDRLPAYAGKSTISGGGTGHMARALPASTYTTGPLAVLQRLQRDVEEGSSAIRELKSRR